MKTIEINSPKYGLKQVLVDDEDYDFLMQWKWSVMKDKYNFYASRSTTGKGGIKRNIIQMHRFIMHQTDPDILVDHRDRNGLNNQKTNLRCCNKSQNMANRKSHDNSTSKYLGVCKRIMKKYDRINEKGEIPIYYYWSPQIQVNKKKYSLGLFPFTPEGEIAAANAYDTKAKELFGEFANLNFKD